MTCLWPQGALQSQSGPGALCPLTWQIHSIPVFPLCSHPDSLLDNWLCLAQRDNFFFFSMNANSNQPFLLLFWLVAKGSKSLPAYFPHLSILCDWETSGKVQTADYRPWIRLWEIWVSGFKTLIWLFKIPLHNMDNERGEHQCIQPPTGGLQAMPWQPHRKHPSAMFKPS